MTTNAEAPRKPGRKPDPLTGILGEVKAKAKEAPTEGLPLRGGKNPEAGRQHYEAQEQRWSTINIQRSDEQALGMDGLLIEDVFAAFGDAEASGSRAALVLLAAQAVVAIDAIDRGLGV
ncbi:hypothetical protein [Streptomyces sp. NBC_01198]|uniref:hypothetical protein n=1 Tax=Streptomyces sp. NBC_01198 TaxID=2903769 RepID=UPI002E1180A4|nr:hypothetical protein OG702_31905 [Streptomyces sp. NBC_01198]